MSPEQQKIRICEFNSRPLLTKRCGGVIVACISNRLEILLQR
jgi:hypothetical protein